MECFEGSGEKLEGDLESVERVKSVELGMEGLGQTVDQELGIPHVVDEKCEGVVEEEVISVGNGDGSVRPNDSVVVASEILENQTVEGSMEARVEGDIEMRIDGDSYVSGVEVAQVDEVSHSQDREVGVDDASVAVTSETRKDQSVEENVELEAGGDGDGSVQVTDVNPNDFVAVASEILENQTVGGRVEVRTEGDREMRIDGDGDVSGAEVAEVDGVVPGQDRQVGVDASVVMTSENRGDQSIEENVELEAEDNERASEGVDDASVVVTSENRGDQSVEENVESEAEDNERVSEGVDDASVVMTSENRGDQSIEENVELEAEDNERASEGVDDASVVVTSENRGDQSVEENVESEAEDNERVSEGVDDASVVATSEIRGDQSVEKNVELEAEDNERASVGVPREGVSEISDDEVDAYNVSVDSDSFMAVEGNSESEDEIDVEVTRAKRGGRLKGNGKESGKPTWENPFASDIVWGKVRSHPWWPGQIFDPSAATKKAKKYYKKDRFLIAYFGDQTFAWNEASLIKPFSEHFSQMEKQSNSEDFHYAVDCALDEVSRRVEFGLACACLLEEIVASIKSQEIVNPGIREELSRIYGGDETMGVESFEPAKLVQYVKSLALSPNSGVDRLEHATSQAQILAVHRSKGYSQLPEFKMLGSLLEQDEEFSLPVNGEHSDKMGEDRVLDVKVEKQVSSGKEKVKSEDSSSRKRKISGRNKNSSEKERTLSELMTKEVGAKLISSNSSKKRKAVDSAVKLSASNGDKVPKKAVGAKLISSSSSKKVKVGAKMISSSSSDKVKVFDSIVYDSTSKPSSSSDDEVLKKEVGAKSISSSSSRKVKVFDSILDNSMLSDDEVPKKEVRAKFLSSCSSKKRKSVDPAPYESVKPSSSNGGNVSKKEVGAKLILYSSKKRRAIDSIADDMAVKLKKNNVSTSSNKPKQTFRVGESILRVASQLNGSASILKYRDESAPKNRSEGKRSKGSLVSASSPKNSEESSDTKYRDESAPKNRSEGKRSKGSPVSASSPKNSEESSDTKFIPAEYCAPGEMLSRLWLAAKNPVKGYNFTISIVCFFSEYRSSVCMDPADFSKLSEDAEESQLEYLSSRIVQSTPNELNPSEKLVSNSDTDQQLSGGTQALEAVDPGNHLDEEPSPTALILNFTAFDSVPSITTLNRIYSQFGPLNESRTEVLKKSSRAKVVFKRRSDAETAFSSTGKYKIFGPSHVSYSLKYMPSTPTKASSHAKKRSKKKPTSEQGIAT